MEIEPFSLPLAAPLETAAGTVDTREGFLVGVTVDGVAGVGEATPLEGWTESREACERALEAVDDPEAALAAAGDGGGGSQIPPTASEEPAGGAWARTDDATLAGAPAARHGVALAVLDARARAADRPLYRHLGAERHVERVPVNATVGAGPPAETAREAATAVADGFPAVKVKVGAGSPSADVDRLAAVREACPDVELRADVNGAWDRETAASVLQRLEGLDVALLEQPLPAGDLAGHAALRGAGVDVAVDEGLVANGLEAVLAAGAADVVVCKPMALGGVDAARQVARTALESGVDPVVTTTVDGAYARAGAVHLAASLPSGRACGLATADRLAADLRTGVAPVRAGAAEVPQGKGNVPPS